jgi:hydrogenase/urease accessory protein HupE
MQRAAPIDRDACLTRFFFTAAAVFGLVLLFTLAQPSAAEAHQLNLTTAHVELLSGRQVSVEIAFAGADIDRMTKAGVFDEKSGRVDPGKLAASSSSILNYVGGHAAVLGADGSPCAAGEAQVAPDKDGVVIRQTWACEKVSGEILYRSTILTAEDPLARQVVMIGSGDDALQALLNATATEVMISKTSGAASLVEVMRLYILTGIEHIFLGYDHVAFLVAIVLWARKVWPVFKIVTAFTLAHSITLSLAALNVVVLPGSFIEPAIAASIIFVAVENFFSRNVDGRWIVTFAFGLIHGFGFASALQEFGLPPTAVVPALAAFNIGVEIGQLAIVSLVVPLLVGLDRLLTAERRIPLRTPQLVYGLSCVITILGSYWLLTRMTLA